MLKYIDSHTHLDCEQFIGEEEDTIKRALDSGVHKMIIPDIDKKGRAKLFEFTDKFPKNTFPCIGIHPTSVDKNWELDFEDMLKYQDRKIYAIGEIGLDLYWSKEYIKEQIEAFRTQIELAHSLDLPIIIHSREATELTLDTLKDYKHLGLRGVFHAYSGSKESFNILSDYGDWYVGIGGVVTYKKASIAETIKHIPLERILLETDSPYLSPVPKRGKRNESSYIPFIAEKIALEKECTLEEVAETTSSNSEKLFSI